ncbi:MAG: DNA alkylation repair protein [Candidatus Glassbacteria bacterium]|nr:DNA alkylation repair protein [Candidatus Glassbacteria bacterium]
MTRPGRRDGLTARNTIKRLEAMGSRENIEGMARYGIKPGRALGVPMTAIRAMSREIGVNHALALELWDEGIHESRLLAALLADPAEVDGELMDLWAAAFDSWALCDTTCGSLFRKTVAAWEKAGEWSRRDELFVKRAGFTMMAWLAVHDKRAPDSSFTPLLKLIRRGAKDERPLVKKAVNWALRQIGKRNVRLNSRAIALAVELAGTGGKAECWVAHGALRELTGSKVQGRLTARKGT